MRTQLIERDDAFELAQQVQIHHEPAGCGARTVRVIVRMATVEGGGIGVAFFGDLNSPCNSRYFAARMVKEGLIAAPHVITDHVACLVIAHPIPRGRALGRARGVITADTSRFTLQEPVTHFSTPCSVTTASRRTSCAAGTMRATSCKA